MALGFESRRSLLRNAMPAMRTKLPFDQQVSMAAKIRKASDGIVVSYQRFPAQKTF
jgi:hypothetical protein